MTTPTPEELALLLTLPPDVRALLAGCAGPGWAVVADEGCIQVGAHFNHRFAADRETEPFEWLPASEVAILDIARRSIPNACDFFIESTRGEWYQAGVGYPGDGGKTWKRGIGPTARLAALRLLAAVTGRG